MPNDQTALSESKVVFASGDESFTVRDLVDAATFRGEIQPIWKELLRMIGAEQKADERELELDDEAIDAAAEKLRELLAAELIFSGELARLATRLSWRVAGLRAAGDKGQDPQLIATEQSRFLQCAGIEEAELSNWLSRLGRDLE